MKLDQNNIHLLLNSFHNGVAFFDECGDIIFINCAALEIFKAENPKNIYEMISDVSLQKIFKIKKPIKKLITIDGILFFCSLTLVKDDYIIWGTLIVLQKTEEIERLFLDEPAKSLTDISEKIIESSADGIYITDGLGYTQKVNKAYEEITGLDRSDLLGKHMMELVEKGLISQSATLLVLESKGPVSILQRIKHDKTVLVSSKPFFDEQGNILMVMTTVRDMTRLKALEDELNKTRNLTEKYELQLRELEIQQIKFGDEIIAESPKMAKIFESAVRVAPYDTTVLLQGESGVGKEIVAQLIHKKSKRVGCFIKVNCGAIPENLLEAELFGYDRGAFTGAKKEGKIGLFALADKGTILLDEIGDLPLNLQVKLLRVLQDKEIIKVGGLKTIKVDVRIIGATNKNLEKEVAKGNFRLDLFYRLNVVPITVPPLRERQEDTFALIKYFLSKLNAKYDKQKQLSPQLIKELLYYAWPGNVRELQNVIEHIFIMCDNDYLDMNNLSLFLKNNQVLNNEDGISINRILPLKYAKDIVEDKLMKMAIDYCGSVRKAALLLEIDHSTIVKRKKKW